MYELALVFQTGDVERRLFPIVTLTGKRDSIFFKDLYDYWNTEYLKKRELLNNLSSGVSLQVIDELGCCDEIIRELPKVTQYLCDVNTLSYDKLEEDDFKFLIDSLKK